MIDTSQPLRQEELRPPTNPTNAGIPTSMIEDILLRTVMTEGRASLVDLAELMHCSVSMLDGIITSLRDRRLIEFEGMSGRTYMISATDLGRAYSRDRSQECKYRGPLPVPLNLYARVVHAQKPDLHLDRDQLARSYSDLVISPTLIDQLGPAICSEGAMFLYGPPGTGKSSIAERMIRAYEDTVFIPHCVEVQGQIISVFDPVLHESIHPQPPELDPRWVRCKRPAVIAGGELHSGMLDLTLDKEIGIYLAPLQFKANNGILVIDDFGRQAMTPEELLNRWIVPLDRQLDYLTLGGRKFAVPFELKIVLSTNLDPAQLGDEAFFRRIHNKIYIGCMDDEQFDWVLARVAQAKKFEVVDGAALHLRKRTRDNGDGELRAYLPAVVVKLATAICKFENLPYRLTPSMIDRVLDLYFAKTVVTPPGAHTPHVETEPPATPSHQPAASPPALAEDPPAIAGVRAALMAAQAGR